MTQPYDVEYASDQYQSWLRALKQDASLVTLNQAQAMMRAVMHALRGCLPAEDVLAVANRFPALPRGIFLEGWSLTQPPSVPASSEEFHRRVYRLIEDHHAPGSDIPAATFAVWSRFLGPEPSQAIRGRLPEALKPLWPAEPKPAEATAPDAETAGIRIVEVTSDTAHLLNKVADLFDDPIHPAMTAAFLADRRHVLTVALDGDLVVGFVSAVEYFHPDKDRGELWINEVGVAEDWQGKGIGKRLLARTLEIGRLLGCSGAWVMTDRDNRAAMRLYARFADGPPTDHVMFTFPLL